MNALRVELTSADVAMALQSLELAGIIITDVETTEAYTIRFTVSIRNWKKLRSIANKRGDTMKVLSHFGPLWAVRVLLRRPVLVIGMVLLLIISLWVPGRVFFVQVEGNAAVADLEIIEAATECGIGFGASRREVRSEKMKNALLGAIPQLQWAGVNTYGCTAVISVRERSDLQTSEKKVGISSMVASRDGVVRSVTVLRGSALCSSGQAVKAGQVLISGYTDCGIFLQATCAEGEVFAETSRTLTAVSPSEYTARGEILSVEKKYALQIGKNRINFYNNSGILGTTCAKIYMEKYLTLPGGFVLPVAVICETWIYHDNEPSRADEAEQILVSFAEAYLRKQMTGGEILSAVTTCTLEDGVMVLRGSYSCYEMIGMNRPEENVTDYESD